PPASASTKPASMATKKRMRKTFQPSSTSMLNTCYPVRSRQPDGIEYEQACAATIPEISPAQGKISAVIFTGKPGARTMGRQATRLLLFICRKSGTTRKLPYVRLFDVQTCPHDPRRSESAVFY